MDDTSTSIVSQCAFKGAIEAAVAMNLNLTVPEHQGVFEELSSFLTQSLFETINARLAMNTQQAVSAVVHAFPGAQAVNQGYAPQAPTQQAQGYQGQQGYAPQQQQAPAHPGVIRIKGDTSGAAFPDWALAAFAEHGTAEVYDNRHTLAESPRRPWFKDTKDGFGFWPPDR